MPSIKKKSNHEEEEVHFLITFFKNPIVSTIIAGLIAGAVTVATIRSDVSANKYEIAELKASSVTQRELDLIIKPISEDISEIKADLRDIKNAFKIK